jgi:hypothetical protein
MQTGQLLTGKADDIYSYPIGLKGLTPPPTTTTTTTTIFNTAVIMSHDHASLSNRQQNYPPAPSTVAEQTASLSWHGTAVSNVTLSAHTMVYEVGNPDAVTL